MYKSTSAQEIVHQLSDKLESIQLVQRKAQYQKLYGALTHNARQPIQKEFAPIQVCEHATKFLKYHEHMFVEEHCVCSRAKREDLPQQLQLPNLHENNTDTNGSIVEEYTDDQQNRHTLLLLDMQNLGTQNASDSDILNAMQQFIDQARDNLKNEQDKIFIRHDTTIVLQQHVHTRAHVVRGEQKMREKTQLHINLKDDEIVYTGITQYRDAQDFIPAVLQTQNHVLRQWHGRIPHIDYEILYDSLDAMFNIVYVNIDVRALVLSSSQIVKQSLTYIAFRSMHFPCFIHKEYIRQGTTTDEQGKILQAPVMPLASIRCYSKHKRDDDTINITNLSHMSVLLALHKQLVPINEMFALQMIQSLIKDVRDIWFRRESIMPQQKTKDIFEYGIVPVVHDQLPQNYDKYLAAPSDHNMKTSMSTNVLKFIHEATQSGTTEMCVWGLTLSCIRAAIQEALPKCDESKKAIKNIESLACAIDIRFSNFHINMKHTNLCNSMFAQDMSQASGGAMPLLCMAICGVMSLSQAISSITNYTCIPNSLYKHKLIRLIRLPWHESGY